MAKTEEGHGNRVGICPFSVLVILVIGFVYLLYCYPNWDRS